MAQNANLAAGLAASRASTEAKEAQRDAAQAAVESFFSGGATIRTVPDNGACLFSAVGLQVGKSAEEVRTEVVDYISAHCDDFFPEGGDACTLHTAKMRNPKEYGGDHEINAIERLYGRPVVIYWTTDDGTFEEQARARTLTVGDPIRLYYYRERNEGEDPDSRIFFHYDAIVPTAPAAAAPAGAAPLTGSVDEEYADGWGAPAGRVAVPLTGTDEEYAALGAALLLEAASHVSAAPLVYGTAVPHLPGAGASAGGEPPVLPVAPSVAGVFVVWRERVLVFDGTDGKIYPPHLLLNAGETPEQCAIRALRELAQLTVNGAPVSESQLTHFDTVGTGVFYTVVLNDADVVLSTTMRWIERSILAATYHTFSYKGAPVIIELVDKLNTTLGVSRTRDVNVLLVWRNHVLVMNTGRVDVTTTSVPPGVPTFRELTGRLLLTTNVDRFYPGTSQIAEYDISGTTYDVAQLDPSSEPTGTGPSIADTTILPLDVAITNIPSDVSQNIVKFHWARRDTLEQWLERAEKSRVFYPFRNTNLLYAMKELNRRLGAMPAVPTGGTLPPVPLGTGGGGLPPPPVIPTGTGGGGGGGGLPPPPPPVIPAAGTGGGGGPPLPPPGGPALPDRITITAAVNAVDAIARQAEADAAAAMTAATAVEQKKAEVLRIKGVIDGIPAAAADAPSRTAAIAIVADTNSRTTEALRSRDLAQQKAREARAQHATAVAASSPITGTTLTVIEQCRVAAATAAAAAAHEKSNVTTRDIWLETFIRVMNASKLAIEAIQNGIDPNIALSKAAADEALAHALNAMRHQAIVLPYEADAEKTNGIVVAHGTAIDKKEADAIRLTAEILDVSAAQPLLAQAQALAVSARADVATAAAKLAEVKAKRAECMTKVKEADAAADAAKAAATAVAAGTNVAAKLAEAQTATVTARDAARAAEAAETAATAALGVLTPLESSNASAVVKIGGLVFQLETLKKKQDTAKLTRDGAVAAAATAVTQVTADVASIDTARTAIKAILTDISGSVVVVPVTDENAKALIANAVSEAQKIIAEVVAAAADAEKKHAEATAALGVATTASTETAAAAGAATPDDALVKKKSEEASKAATSAASAKTSVEELLAKATSAKLKVTALKDRVTALKVSADALAATQTDYDVKKKALEDAEAAEAAAAAALAKDPKNAAAVAAAAAAVAATKAARTAFEAAEKALDTAKTAHGGATATPGVVHHGTVPSWVPPDYFTMSNIKPACANTSILGSEFITHDCVAKGVYNDIKIAEAFSRTGRLVKRRDPKTEELRKLVEKIKVLEKKADPKSVTELALTREQLEEKYPSAMIQVRVKGKPEVFEVPNPYTALAYREDNHPIARWADPAAKVFSRTADPSGNMYAMNLKILKELAPQEMIVDHDVAVALLESLWYCGKNPTLSSDPRCFPARLLGELREWKANKDAMKDVAALKKKMMESRWPILKGWAQKLMEAYVGNKPISAPPPAPAAAAPAGTSTGGGTTTTGGGTGGGGTGGAGTGGGTGGGGTGGGTTTTGGGTGGGGTGGGTTTTGGTPVAALLAKGLHTPLVLRSGVPIVPLGGAARLTPILPRPLTI